jgi:hypothetical protein
MTISDTLVATGTATTNPAPNGLSPVIPATFSGGRYTPTSAWTDQAKPALFPLDLRDGGGDKPIQLCFIPSDGAAVTYTLTAWQWNRIASTWVVPKDNSTFSLTGADTLYLERPGADPWFIQLSVISSGTINVTFDGSLARAL